MTLVADDSRPHSAPTGGLINTRCSTAEVILPIFARQANVDGRRGEGGAFRLGLSDVSARSDRIARRYAVRDI